MPPLAEKGRTVMTKVAIFPVPSDHGTVTYWAMGHNKRSHGATAGEALDALTQQLTEDETATLVVIQNQRPDRFFNSDQQIRLGELMSRWRTCRAMGGALPGVEQAELEKLVEAELEASAARASVLADELKP
jgi:hypothetical protein